MYRFNNVILFIGPSKLPITGQSYSFHKTFECVNTPKHMLTFGKGAWGNCLFIFRYLSLLMVYRPTKIYLTTSRSSMGFLRDMVVIIFGRLMSSTIVNHLHGADFRKFYYSCNPLSKCIVHNVYSKINTSIVLMEIMKDQYSMFPSMNVLSVPNFFINEADQNEIYERKSAFIKSARESLVVTYFSNIMFSKGVFDVLDAAQLSLDIGLKIQFNFAGDFVSDSFVDNITIRSRFMSAIDSLPNANYLGVVVGKDRENLLLNSDIFLFPSFYDTEALPISMLEALSCGCFVIATDHNYLPDLLPA
jgi:glycosyltransferase involved in cell wall biosynthesis